VPNLSIKVLGGAVAWLAFMAVAFLSYLLWVASVAPQDRVALIASVENNAAMSCVSWRLLNPPQGFPTRDLVVNMVLYKLDNQAIIRPKALKRLTPENHLQVPFQLRETCFSQTRNGWRQLHLQLLRGSEIICEGSLPPFRQNGFVENAN
jgi:hypothetical protein